VQKVLTKLLYRMQTTKLTNFVPKCILVVVGDVNTKEVKKLVTKLLALGPKESLRRSHILILKCAANSD
jgi:predicted Zn-dependent peptidase